MVAELTDLLIIVSGKHGGEMRDPKPHLSSEGRGQQLARNLCRVDRGGWVEAIVAIAALIGWAFAERAQQDRSAAARCLDKGGQGIEPLALPLAPLGLDLELDSAARDGEIFGRPEQ